MIDISVAATKERAARWAASWEPEFGPAGTLKTRRDPVLLADRHKLRIEEFCQHVPADRRDEFKASVLNRLSGFPMMGAVVAAAKAALSDMGFSEQDLRGFGFIKTYDQGFRHPPKAAQEGALIESGCPALRSSAWFTHIMMGINANSKRRKNNVVVSRSRVSRGTRKGAVSVEGCTEARTKVRRW